MNPWLLLGLAIACELIGSTALKAARGFTRPLPSIAVLTGYGLSFFLLSQALTSLPLSLSYAVWAGVGVAATAIIGAVIFGERPTRWRLAGLALVVVGTTLLNLFTKGAP